MRRFAIALAALLVVAVVVPAFGQTYYYDYRPPDPPDRGYDPTWPPEGSQWHQLMPNYCQYDEQTNHEDADGNGAIDVCEHIWFNGERQHVEWIGPTYKLVFMGTGKHGRPVAPKYLEEAGPGDKQFSYHEVFPTYCNIVETTEPITDECQEVWIEFPPEDVGWWHVEEINTNIRTVPDPVNPADESTWGKIKEFFRNLL